MCVPKDSGHAGADHVSIARSSFACGGDIAFVWKMSTLRYGVTRAMLRGQNTQVFGVYPGPIDTRMGEALPVEKASPADAARAIVAGIIAGDEEIFPDKMSQGAGPAFFADPKGLERHVAGVPAAA